MPTTETVVPNDSAIQALQVAYEWFPQSQGTEFDGTDPVKMATRIIAWAGKEIERRAYFEAQNLALKRTRYLRRHAGSLEEAVVIANAAKTLGGMINIYDNNATSDPHWLVEIIACFPDNDWSPDREGDVND